MLITLLITHVPVQLSGCIVGLTGGRRFCPSDAADSSGGHVNHDVCD